MTYTVNRTPFDRERMMQPFRVTPLNSDWSLTEKGTIYARPELGVRPGSGIVPTFIETYTGNQHDFEFQDFLYQPNGDVWALYEQPRTGLKLICKP